MTGWHLGRFASGDFEATGVDPTQARAVTFSILLFEPTTPAGGHTISGREWLIDPGVEIPAQATAVHGITTEYARQHGCPPAAALAEISDTLTSLLEADTPVIIMNAPYDLTLLHYDAKRHGVTPPDERSLVAPIVDPGVIDKQMMPRRRGKRRLADLCGVYAVPVDNAHNATADAWMAAAVTYQICNRYPQVAETDPYDLHHRQVGWRAQQQTELAEYFRSVGKPADDIFPDWPIRLPALATIPG